MQILHAGSGEFPNASPATAAARTAARHAPAAARPLRQTSAALLRRPPRRRWGNRRCLRGGKHVVVSARPAEARITAAASRIFGCTNPPHGSDAGPYRSSCACAQRLAFSPNCVCYTRSVLHVPEGEKKLLKPRAPSRSIALSSPVSCELAGTMPPQNPTSTMTLPCETFRTSSLLQNCGLQVTQSHGLTMWNGAPCRTEGAASAPTLP